MTLFRSLLFYGYFGLLTSVYGMILALAIPIASLRTRSSIGCAWGRHTLAGLSVICGLRYRVQGLEKLQDSRNALIMCKHQSAWETVALRALLPPNQSWVLKRELLFIPFFGWGLASTLPIAIDRGTPKQALKQLLVEGEQRLRNGDWLVIFPEGTRVATGTAGRYASGGAQLAIKAEVDILPIAHNAGVFWKRQGVLKHPGVIDMVVGDRIATRDRAVAAIMHDVRDWIEGEIEKLPSIAVSQQKS